jgi:hypothetical protein
MKKKEKASGIIAMEDVQVDDDDTTHSLQLLFNI